MNSDDRPAAAVSTRGRGFKPALRRHWWWILSVWLVVSFALAALVILTTRTTYDATAWLIIRTSTPRIFDQNGGVGDFSRYQKTQVDLVTSPDVLGDALALHPELADLPILRGAEEDPEAEIRKLLRVQIRPDTNLITVSITSEDKHEAIAIVNAVVASYLAAANNWATIEATEQISRLNEESRKLHAAIDAKKAKLRALVERLGSIDTALLKDQGRISLERFQNFLANYDSARMRRIDLESKLEAERARAGRSIVKVSQESDEERAKRAFDADPAVADLIKQKVRTQAALDWAKRLANTAEDPSVVPLQRRVDELDAKLKQLWEILGPELKKSGPELKKSLKHEAQIDENDKSVQDLEAEVLAAKRAENALSETIQRMEIDNKTQGGDALEVVFAQDELNTDEKLLMSIQGHVQQLEFDAKGPARVDKANMRTRIDAITRPRWVLRVALIAPVLLLPFLALCALIGDRFAAGVPQEDSPAAPPEEPRL